MKIIQKQIQLIFLLFLFLSLFFSSCMSTTKQKEPKPSEVTPLEKTLEEDPDEAFTKIGFAENLSSLLQKGSMQEALALFDTVPEPEASDFSIRSLKLSLMISAGLIDESQELAQELENVFPNNPDLTYTQAMIATAKNDQPSRTKYLNQVLKLQPDHTSALIALGTDYLSRRNYTQAKKNLLNALRLDPKNTDALLVLARTYYMENDLEKAKDVLNLAIKEEPSYGSLWAERARVKSESNDIGGAIKDIKTATNLEPFLYRHWLDLGTYNISYAKKQEAIEAFTKAIEIDPNYHLSYIYRAGLHDDLGYKDKAILDYQKVCALYPQYFYAAESLGVLLWEKQDWEKSNIAFQQALYYNPKNASYALMATACLYRQNKPSDAKIFMDKYLATLDRNSTEYYLCRLFVDRSGEMDVLNRILKEKNPTQKSKMLFYSALYYDIFQSKTIAQKYYMEALTIQNPSFFEYRLCENELKQINNALQSNLNETTRS